MDEVPRDALDRAALEGVPSQAVNRSHSGYKVARTVMPVLYDKSCGKCHFGRSGGVSGALSVTVSMKEHERIISSHRIKFYIWGGAILLATSFAVLMLVHRRLLEPLESLRQGALELAGGRFDYRVHLRSGDEFEELGEAFDGMAASLAAAAEDLRHGSFP
ncbi:MAG: HAMP domain-containing protein [Deltaproteobacteria bacterium]|nr:HAMP domain-containing protein [Deltaproteobacteria bacterium]